MEVIAHLEDSELSCVSSDSASTFEECKVISVEGMNLETRRVLLYFADDRLAPVDRVVSAGSPTSETQAIVSALTSLLAKQTDGRYEVSFSNESGSNGAQLQRIRFHASERTITLNYIFGVRNEEGSPVPPLLQIDESRK